MCTIMYFSDLLSLVLILNLRALATQVLAAPVFAAALRQLGRLFFFFGAFYFSTLNCNTDASIDDYGAGQK